MQGGGFYRPPGGEGLGVRARVLGCAQGRLGVGVPALVGLRPKVGDDRRDPPVSGSGRRGAQLGRAGPPSSQAEERRGGGAKVN
jgi:hypothetical protein